MIKSESIYEVDTKTGFHGKLVYPNGKVNQWCAEYCMKHVSWLKQNGFKFVPIHEPENCAGMECGHNEPRPKTVDRNCLT